MRSDVIQIFKQTPHNKQVMMFSATLNEELKKVCRKFMQKVSFFFINEKFIFVFSNNKVNGSIY